MKTELTQEQKRIKIAEACGWIPQEPWKNADGNLVYEWIKQGNLNEDCIAQHTEHGLPDYFNDLNAMHEAEKTLNDNQYEKFGKELVISGMGQNRTEIEAGRATLSATAAQRAEAFGKTLGLW